MQAGVLLGSLAALAILAPAPAASRAADCTGASCGVPSCWEPDVRARPGMARTQRIQCSHVTAARVASGPAHGQITQVRLWWYGVDFELRPDTDAPRFDEAVFELTGPEGSVQQRVTIENVPLSENSPPVCDGDVVSQRSSGTAPVDVFMHPYCRDPDLDDFVIHGGGPGFHQSSPLAVIAGESESNWPYRTATHSGTETGTIWAVDSLGARSQDAQLRVTVGPAVDRLPTCRPNPAYWTADGVFPIAARPGEKRRFAVICEDADADALLPVLTAPPERGLMPVFLPGLPSYGFWGVENWVEVTYVPADESLEPDEFTVTAEGLRGDGPANRMAIVPRPLPQNAGGGCGHSGVQTPIGVPAVLQIDCSDDEGDPFSVEVVDGPLHGTAGPPVITPARFGGELFAIPYTPNPGYEGYDCVKVRVSDGHGLEFTLTVDINVVKPDLVVPPVPQLPGAPPIPLPSAGPTPPGAPAASDLRTLAERALGAPRVRRVRTGAADVWKPRRLSRRRLLDEARAPALFVICRSRCNLASRAHIDVGRAVRRRRRAGQRTTAAVMPAAGRLLWIAAGRAERRALRRQRRGRAAFDLRVRPQGGERRRVRQTIPIGR